MNPTLTPQGFPENIGDKQKKDLTYPATVMIAFWLAVLALGVGMLYVLVRLIRWAWAVGYKLT